MAKCVFCGVEKPNFTGVFLMRNDGSVNFFCGSKCRKNMLKLGRDKRKIRWTEAFHLTREKARQKKAQLENVETKTVEKTVTKKSTNKSSKKVSKK